MAGTSTRAGGFFETGFAATDTATVVRRLQDAGAIIVGKAQLTEGRGRPPPRHPAARESLGAGAMVRVLPRAALAFPVAAGLAYGAIGTDTAGSIRFPSACNGLVGLKPTWGVSAATACSHCPPPSITSGRWRARCRMSR